MEALVRENNELLAGSSNASARTPAPEPLRGAHAAVDQFDIPERQPTTYDGAGRVPLAAVRRSPFTKRSVKGKFMLGLFSTLACARSLQAEMTA